MRLFGVQTPGGENARECCTQRHTHIERWQSCREGQGRPAGRVQARLPAATVVGNQCLAPRFALTPGAYKFEIIGPDGKATVKDVTVTATPMLVK